MTTISHYLSGDHGRCDDLFAECEMHAARQKWTEAVASCARFGALLERHFQMEEAVLFQAFELATGNASGPTRVMRLEHEQMRNMLASMRAALESRHADNFFGCADTLNTLMQQHNMKEENILYPMADNVLRPRAQEIIQAMTALQAADVASGSERAEPQSKHETAA
ncbi:hemerythrin domain-containing protein [Noviherbaspirillum galbum]|uniref:Hemerythrin domain-containing protein n=1 Tax=Noviherbaspirillum galbum TaxID=2709383 RepID=A0A6B3SNG5_9BURK|nr:hemerythrin domain-containing protein [Noviherbaspirillum galbum]NEX62271.1 hemerythrin domain-containing protein [Noviherbaspirillum galbum]